MKLTVDDTKADGTFVYYALRSPLGQHEILSRALTAGVPHINLGLLGQVQIPSPPLPIQRKIAAILSAYDDFIENNRRRIRILEEMAGRIYREWFVDLRYPGGEGVSFVDSLLGAIPVGWSVLPLSDLAEVTKGLSYSGSYLGDCGRAMANLKCLDPAGGYRREGTKPYSGPCQRKHEVAAGDVVVANTDLTQAGNVIGAPAIIPRRGFEQGGLITHHLFSVKPEEGVQRSFLFETLRKSAFGCLRGVGPVEPQCWVCGLATVRPTLCCCRRRISANDTEPLRRLAPIGRAVGGCGGNTRRVS